MDPFEILLCLQILKLNNNRDYAVLIPDVGSNFRAAVHPQPIPFGDETAMAALLHRERDDLDRYMMIATYEPTEMCLGLAWRAKVRAIYVPAGGWSHYAHISVGDADALPGGWRRQTVPAPTAVNTQLLTSPVWRSQHLRNAGLPPELMQALLNPTAGRTTDGDIARKLAHGLHSCGSAVPSPNPNDDFMKIVYALVRLGWNDKLAEPRRPGAAGLRPFGNNIGGLIVDANNKIIAWGLNFKQVNPTFHAETMMIQYYLRRHNVSSLPANCRVFTSLECCHMCAGYIATVGPGTQVFYAQKDPNIVGPNALERGVNGCHQQAGHFMQAIMGPAMGSGDRQIIDFLFDKQRSKPIFQRGMTDTRTEEKDLIKRGQIMSPVLRQGNRFLMDLQDVGILHESRGAPLSEVFQPL
ncbi:MAG TPA: hypothetical protein PKD86_09890 [Gemmatales bacterium]|nr:hypothetical protein [Gemmatales bacterium]HMP59653.1 hypothetical protein [Gemmatales bacterium]